MPTYEYECERTGRRLEAFQNITAEPIQQCPECGGKARRLIGSGGAVIFKGSGFYATDYRKPDPQGPSCGRSQPCCGRDDPCDK